MVAPAEEPEVGATGRNACRIAVIGGGFSGVLVTLHLLWRCGRDDRIYLIERASRFGQGLAYASGNPQHLLNVPIQDMSAFADEPDHFARWLAGQPETEGGGGDDPGFAGGFVRRQMYGAYITHLLTDSITRLGGGRNLYLINDEATALRPADGGFLLETGGGRAYGIDAAVLALGNFPPDQRQAPGYYGDPWQPQAVRDLIPGRPVLLIGTGLTMVDVCLALLGGGFDGPVYALSRRGLLPHPHAPAPRWDGLKLHAEDRRSLAALCRAVRREVRRAADLGFDWRSAMDALRPHTQLLWQELAPADKRRFLRHLRSWWEIHRHRMAPSVAARIAAARGRGVLRVVGGRLERIEAAGDGLRAFWRAARRGCPAAASGAADHQLLRAGNRLRAHRGSAGRPTDRGGDRAARSLSPRPACHHAGRPDRPRRLAVTPAFRRGSDRARRALGDRFGARDPDSGRGSGDGRAGGSPRACRRPRASPRLKSIISIDIIEYMAKPLHDGPPTSRRPLF